METKEIIGIVQNIKLNRKSLAIENEWFNNFNLLPEDLQKGQTVKITYTIKEVDGKKFNNIKRLEQVITLKDIPEKQINITTNQIPNQTQNCILMCVKDIVVKDLDTGSTFNEKEMTDKILKLTLDFTQAYKRII